MNGLPNDEMMRIGFETTWSKHIFVVPPLPADHSVLGTVVLGICTGNRLKLEYPKMPGVEENE
ncbi:MAG: hypothetical protein EOO00_13600 [Chitinophagaceae bacterium]|nr:MAG: hypothetical protein EOO00_13600 [Chitinophagaceae bacterium]